MYNIHSTSTTRFYWLVGTAFYYNEEKYRYNNVIQRIGNFGAGVGFEFELIKQISLSFNGALQFYYKTANGLYNVFSDKSDFSRSIYFGFGGGTSLYYNF